MTSSTPSPSSERRGGSASGRGTPSAIESNPLLRHGAEWCELLRVHFAWWAVPTAAAFVLALGYALFSTPTWRAEQALVVRDEAVGNVRGGGRFESVDAMKTFLETVLEVARSQPVVEAALREVGPPSASYSTNDWPPPAVVAALEGAISVRAPNGTEFGRTEMVYLCVDATDPERAIALNRAVGNQLVKHLQILRDARAQSVVDELRKKVQLDEAELATVTRDLEAADAKLGSDLGTLRPLLETGGGDNNLQTVLTQTRNELRQARSKQAGLELQRKLLTAMSADPTNLLATPNQLLEAHPALRRLKDGLVDSQLKAADLQGRMSAEHPEVIAARQAVAEVQRNLIAEVQVAIRGLDADLNVNAGLIVQLEQQENETVGKLEKLAKVRASYSNLVAEVKHRTQILEDDRKRLADAQASRDAAATTSLITRLDPPAAGDRPLGPGRTVVVLGGAFGGLAMGLGLVFLITSPQLQVYSRRWSDFLHGRRSTDVTPDGQAIAASAASRGRRDDSRNPPRPVTPSPATSPRRHTDLEPVPAPVAPSPAPPAHVAAEDSAPDSPNPSDTGRRRNADRRQSDRRS